ncbi:MAG: NAD(P)/FAD-dependent oxidoreductase [Ruminococcaceae bacterium]|nr:NAD(P)/FAD-dependent oxidoreductase [Oscillospiraceae bacterium]
MKKCDVVVIGAATSGSFFARKISEKGFSVKVIEKSSREKVGSRYDIFHIGRKEFERFSIPRPVEGDEEWAFEFETNYTASPTGKYPVKTFDPMVGLHMHGYTVLMNKWAEEKGAEIEYEAEFQDFLFENGKIAGVTYIKDNKTHPLYAKCVVDCTGLSSAARRKLPDGCSVEKFEITPEDMFYVVLKYVKFKDPDFVYNTSSTGWPSYKSWLAPQADPNGGILGIGACHSYEQAEKNLEDVIKNIPLPEYTVTHVEKGRTPYTRPPYSYVTDNFIVTGDAGCLTKPNNGEGVTSSMVQMEIAADVLADALKADDLSEKNLWKINKLYNIKQGADFASTRALLTKIVRATNDEFEFIFEKAHDVLQVFLDGAADGPEIKFPVLPLMKAVCKITGGIFTKKISTATLKFAVEGLKLSGKLKKHYLDFPDSPYGFAQWKNKADELWAKVGKMK